MTQVWGANTLQVDHRCSGDAEPVELSYGEFLRFDGLNCPHHALPNTTDATRLSFDFRVIPRRFWLNNYGQRIGDYDCEFAMEKMNE